MKPKNRAKGLGKYVRYKGPRKRGHIVAETLLLMTFPCARKLGNICCGHKMFLNKIRNIFCVPDTKFVSATNVARAGKRGNICVGNNVSSFARAFTAPGASHRLLQARVGYFSAHSKSGDLIFLRK